MPAASYALLPNLKNGLFLKLLPSERDLEFLSSCFLHSSAQMCLYQTPGRRPPPITGRFVNTVTRGWVGAPNEGTPFRFHGAVVGFVDRCLSRTRNLAASNKRLAAFFSGRSWPKIGAGAIFFGFFLFYKNIFFEDLCSSASGTEIFWRVSLKFEFFMETSRFHCHRSNSQNGVDIWPSVRLS